MQKRSHELLARTLMCSYDGFRKKRYELAFLFGSFQPDCNPLSYIKGSIRHRTLRGHNFSNSQHYVDRHIDRLQCRAQWTIWQYYTLGKLTHYLADAFTFPHNETYEDSLAAHRRYEDTLRSQLARYLDDGSFRRTVACADVVEEIDRLHLRYLDTVSDGGRDIRYILKVNSLLMASLLPQAT